jgi:membrane protease YdiL (CAAX protease family)
MSFFWQAVFVEGGLAVVAVVVALFFGIDYLAHCRCDGETLFLIGAATLILVAGYFVLQALPLASLRQIDRLVRNFFCQYMGQLTLGQLALIAALAGIGEELFFRGMIQLGLFLLGVGEWLAILLTSLLFGLAHAITPIYFLLAFFISLYLGFLFLYTDNLLIPIAVHALYDFFVFLFIRFTPQKNQL